MGISVGVKSIGSRCVTRVIPRVRERKQKEEEEERERRGREEKKKIDKGRIGDACRGKTLGKRNFVDVGDAIPPGISQYYENYILVKWNSLLLLCSPGKLKSARSRSSSRDQGAPA